MIKILDCTLRDGGYINDWNFGNSNIKKIISDLTKAGIELVECGFLEDVEYQEDRSFFSNVLQIKELLPENRGVSEYIAMTRFGKLDINNLKEYDGTSISGIRVTFHIDEVEEALKYCKKVKDKGYKLFVQPVGTTSYTDEELLSLIKKVNLISPYAFYIVDTLGVMIKKDIHRLYYLIDNNLNKDINIGFHSHNNLQMSFSNSQELVSSNNDRGIFLDSSVSGMGRGAGNLNTELIAQYINSNLGYKYNIDSVLSIVEEYILTLKPEYKWGYSVPYYLAAIYNTHPDYASFLINKKTLDVNSIAKIINTIPHEKREMYNKSVIEDLYYSFQKHTIDDSFDKEKLKQKFSGKEILIIAPGNSIVSERTKVQEFISEKKPGIISVNFVPEDYNSDFVFFSNLRRFKNFQERGGNTNQDCQVIVTSNIEQQKEKSSFIINYADYLNDYSYIQDNATLMLLKFLSNIECGNISIAGFDGYDFESDDNYYKNNLETHLDKNVYIAMNKEINDFLSKYQETTSIKFITPSKYI